MRFPCCYLLVSMRFPCCYLLVSMRFPCCYLLKQQLRLIGGVNEEGNRDKECKFQGNVRKIVKTHCSHEAKQGLL